MARHPVRACSIEQVGKQRNGRPRYWCSVHQASATGRFGVRLAQCETAYRDKIPQNVLRLDPIEYPGGVALWGAVGPVYDTSGLPPESGIHVHARKGEDGKEIDATYDAVIVPCRRDLLDKIEPEITADAAVAYYISRFLKRDVTHLFCTYCSEIHLDKDFFAAHPHRRHLCHGCGRQFQDDRKGVSNPINLLHASGSLSHNSMPPSRPNRPLDIRQRDFPGGLQIWASNPALLWTAERAEEEGIHVHAFGADGEYALDETYSSVTIDDIRLDEEQVQYMMVQLALSHLANKILSLECPKCGHPHFDRGDNAVYPHKNHECESCGELFETSDRRRLVVSNPFVETRDLLFKLRGAQEGIKP